MAIRTINYTVSVGGITPASQQFGGTQGDHNAVELKFTLDTELYNNVTANAEGTVYYRFDGYDGSGGVKSTEPAPLDNKVCQYSLEEWLTRYGGKVQVYLMLTDITDTTEMELYSFPAVLNLKDRPDGHSVDGGDYESISTLYEGAKASADSAKDAAERAEQVLDDLGGAIPNIDVTEVSDGVEITITSKDGIETAKVYDGQDGKDGKNGKDGKDVDYSLVANALKGFASGSVISLKDVSPLEHTVKVKTGIGGSEVLTKTEVLAAKGDSVLLNNPSKSVRIVMIGGAYCVGGVIPLVDGDNDDLTQLEDFTDIAIVPQGSYGEVHGIRDITYRIEGNTLKWEGFGGVWYQNEVSERFDISGEYTLNSSECNIIGFYQVYALDESNPNYQTPQYDHLDIEVSVYEGEGATVKVCGKNLFDISKVTYTYGTAITNNGDGTLTIATGSTAGYAGNSPNTLRDYAPDLKVGETYYLSAISPKPENITTSYTNNYIYLKDSKTSWFFNSSNKITEEMLNSIVYWFAWGQFPATTTISNFQIEKGTTATEYEPYKEPVTYTADANGEINIPSQYPSMTIIPDTEVELSVEYNRDINKAFAELASAIISMGGNL